MIVEWLLFLVVLLAGAVPFLRKDKVLFAFLFLGAAAVFGAARWYDQQQRREYARAERAASVPREGWPGGYVTSDTCQSFIPSNTTRDTKAIIAR